MRCHGNATDMKRPRTPVQWSITFAVLALVLAAGLLASPYLYIYANSHLYGPAKGLYWRTFRAPAILNAGFIEPIDPQREQEQLKKFCDVYESHQGSYGLRQLTASVEGSLVGKCLVTEDGRLTLVVDQTRDANSDREIIVAHPSSVTLAPVEQGTNQAASASAPADVYLICTIGGRRVHF